MNKIEITLDKELQEQYKAIKTLTDIAIRLNDAFYEIVTGKYRGNLVHIWNTLTATAK